MSSIPEHFIDWVANLTNEDLLKEILEIAEVQGEDVIFDSAGADEYAYLEKVLREKLKGWLKETK